MEFNGTFLATIITFGVFVFFMNKILYAPILEVMQNRKDFVDENYKSAEADNKMADKLVAEKDEKLVEAKSEAREKYNTVISEYKTQKAEVIASAHSLANEQLEQSNVELLGVSNDVKNSLKSKMTDLANDIVEKVIGYRSDVQGFDNDAVDRVLYH